MVRKSIEVRQSLVKKCPVNDEKFEKKKEPVEKNDENPSVHLTLLKNYYKCLENLSLKLKTQLRTTESVLQQSSYTADLKTDEKKIEDPVKVKKLRKINSLAYRKIEQKQISDRKKENSHSYKTKKKLENNLEIDYIQRICKNRIKNDVQQIRNIARQQIKNYFISKDRNKNTKALGIAEQKRRFYVEKCEKYCELCENSIITLQNLQYRNEMKKTEDYVRCLEQTESLKIQKSNLQNHLLQLSSEIFSIENVLIRRTVYQNFLISFENFFQDYKNPNELRTAIENIKSMNIRDRSTTAGADVWAVKKFYEHEYLPNCPETHISVEGWRTIISDRMKDLKSQNFQLLKIFQSTAVDLENIKRVYFEKQKTLRELIEKKKLFGSPVVTNYRVNNKLKNAVQKLVDTDLPKSLASPQLRTMEGLFNVFYKRIIPQSIQNDNFIEPSALEKIESIEEHLHNLLAKFDKIPTAIRKRVELSYRKELERLERKSRRAFVMERQIKRTEENLKRSLAPAFKKPL